MEASDESEWFTPRPNRCLYTPPGITPSSRGTPADEGQTVKLTVCDRGRRRVNSSSQRTQSSADGHRSSSKSDSFTSDHPVEESHSSSRNGLLTESSRDSLSGPQAQSTFQEYFEDDDPFGDENYYSSEFKTVAIPSGSRDRFPIGQKLSASITNPTSQVDHRNQVNGEVGKKRSKSSSLSKQNSMSRSVTGFSLQPEDIACDDAGYLHRSNTSLNKSTGHAQVAALSRGTDVQINPEDKSLRNLNFNISFNVQDASPDLIHQRLVLLLDNDKFEEAAILVQRIPSDILRDVISGISFSDFIGSVPESLCLLHSLYVRLHDDNKQHVLLPKTLLSRLVEWLASDEDCNIVHGELGSQSRFLPHIQRLLQFIGHEYPELIVELCQRERRLAHCLEDLGSHCLLDHGDIPVSLYETLKSELIQTVHNIKAATQRIDDINNVRSLKKRKNSEVISHQRLIHMSHADVERRLIQNKCLLDLVKPSIHNKSLTSLLHELETRIEADKRVIVLLSELNKELRGGVPPSAMLAPVFQKLHSSCKYLHGVAEEVCKGQPWMADAEKCSSTNFSGCDAPVPAPPTTAPPSDQDNCKFVKSEDGKPNNSEPITADVTSANGSACSITSIGADSRQEVDLLRLEVRQLQRELSKCRETIQTLEDREAILKDRLSEQALRCIEVSSKFEDLSLGNDRPTQLVRRYGNLYTETRLDAFDALEDLPEIADFDDLKGKLLFSVVVLAFRSIQHTLADTRTQVRQLLCLPASDAKVHEPAACHVEDAISIYLRKSVSKYDTSKNIKEVSEQVWSTLYDYPSLRQCEGLRRYITECVQLAWALSVQNPPLVIDYSCDVFNDDIHTRFHTSDPESRRVRCVLWPVLREGDNGPCVYKGVVIT